MELRESGSLVISVSSGPYYNDSEANSFTQDTQFNFSTGECHSFVSSQSFM